MNLCRRELIVGGAAALAGCNILPEESEPVEASATAPAVLDASDYSLVVENSPTIEATVTVDLSGDVQVTNRQDVIATIYQRVYEGPDGRRFGLLTAPAVTVLEQQDIDRDPVAALAEARQVALATDADVESVSEWSEDGAATMLGTETTRMATTATVGGSEQRLARVRVRAGEDSVTAIATDSDGTALPFDAVTRDA